MVILESIACGTPVVATGVGGIPNIIKKNSNGLLLDDLDAKNIATTLELIHFHDYNRFEVAKTIEKFTSKHFISSFDKIIKKILTDRSCKIGC